MWDLFLGLLGIGGQVMQTYGQIQQARNQAQQLQRQAQYARVQGQLAKERNDLVHTLTNWQVGRMREVAEGQIERRTAVAQARAKRNNRITEERRNVLLRRLGYAAQDEGEAAGQAIAAGNVQAGASGFSISSISYERRRMVTRNELRDRLLRLNEEYTDEEAILRMQTENQNLSLLEQTYIQNEGTRDQFYLRANDLMDQLHLRNQELREATIRSEFAEYDALQNAEFASSGIPLIAASGIFNVGSLLANSINSGSLFQGSPGIFGTVSA